MTDGPQCSKARLARARTDFLAALVFLFHARPSVALRFLLGGAALFVAFLDVLGIALLFSGVFAFDPWAMILLAPSCWKISSAETRGGR